MRDKRFVAVHRGGMLNKEQHYQLIELACIYAEHVMPLVDEKIEDPLIHALLVARDWKQGKASVGDARKASLSAIAVANELSNPTDIAIARCVGHAVATAHMADHSLVVARYALKAVKSAGKSIDAERRWQDEQLTEEIKELFLSARENRIT